MVSQTLASAILNQKAPDIVGSFREGQEFAKGQQVEKLTGQALQAGGGQKLQELIGLDPEVGYNLAEAIGARSAKELNNFIRDASITENFFKQGNFDQGRQFIQQSLDTVKMAGGSGKIQQNLLDIYDSEGPQSALDNVQSFTSVLAKSKQQGQASAKTEILPNGTVIQAMPDGTVRVKNPRGLDVEGDERVQVLKASQKFTQEAEREAAKLKVDTAISKEEGLADVQLRTAGPIERVKAVEKATGKGISDRQQGFIDSGVSAADSTANIRRSIELLDEVKTGGFAAVSAKAKRLFGVESANEGELSANLGQAVLAQLKPLFGAAFTAGEGERLESISARFSSNTETNKRLLGQILKASERSARRAINAAEKAGDDFTAQEIRDSLSFVIDANEPDTSDGLKLIDEMTDAELEAELNQ
jgi:hypothetical protein